MAPHHPLNSDCSIFIVSLTLSLVLLFSWNQNGYASPYKVDVEKLNVREEPTRKSRIVFKLHKNDIVEVISTSEWSEINYNGRTGYVYSSYIHLIHDEDNRLFLDSHYKNIFLNIKKHIIDYVRTNSWMVWILVIIIILAIVSFYIWLFHKIIKDSSLSLFLKLIWDLSYIAITTIPIIIAMWLMLMVVNYLSVCGILSFEYWFRFVMNRELENPSAWWDYMLNIFFWFNDLLVSLFYSFLIFSLPLLLCGYFTVSGYFLSYISKTFIIFVFCCALYDDLGNWFICTFGTNSTIDTFFNYCFINEFMPSMCPVIFGICAVITILLPSLGLNTWRN